MVKIEAVIKPYVLDKVREALTSAGVTGITVYEVKGAGSQSGQHQLYRGAEYVVDFVPNVKVETVVEDSQQEQVMEVLARAAKTGKVGDGKIFAYPIGRAVGIRTGETGARAL